jgi:tetratricopeptide (TPR) repeat protein
MEIAFLIFSAGIVTVWAARLAISKGRNPLVWGGVSLLLAVLPMISTGLAEFQAVGIIPVLILLFLKHKHLTEPDLVNQIPQDLPQDLPQNNPNVISATLEAPELLAEPSVEAITEVVLPDLGLPTTQPYVRQKLTPVVFTDRGITLLDQGQTSQAIDQFTKALGLDSNYIQALENRIRAYEILGHSDLVTQDKLRLDRLF